MPDYRKPPHQPTPRRDGGSLPSVADDSGGFSLETTQMRLKSIKLRRNEVEVAQVQDAVSREAVPEKFLQRDRPAGRVRHDERGMAVWDWAVASGEFAALSATHMMKKLSIDDLKIEETQSAIRALAQPAGGGGDPYNQRATGPSAGEAAQRQGVIDYPDRPRSVLNPFPGTKK